MKLQWWKVRNGRAGSPVISPTVHADLRNRGVAEVIVYLREPIDDGHSNGRFACPSHLRSCFVHSPLTQSYPAGNGSSGSDDLDVGYYHNLQVLHGTVDREALRRLRAHKKVAVVAGSPLLSFIHPVAHGNGNHSAALAWGVKALEAPQLWEKGFDGSGIVVGHLDSGVAKEHNALGDDAVAAFTDTDDVGNLVASERRDPDGHGTHTAGIIAGRLNGIGMAPKCRLASAIVGAGGHTMKRLLGGLSWAVDQNVRVVNMSLGVMGFSGELEPLMENVRALGILPVVAVGNEGVNTSRSPGNYANALSVGAVNRHLVMYERSSSQRFPREDDPLVPDLVAPGVAILSASLDGGFRPADGTSVAAPHIAGLAALLFQAKPDSTPEEVESAIFRSCRLPASLASERANRGFPNAVRALSILTGA
ncbi:MAG: in [Thermoanaerobaculia bacterium]|jgi:subtilisin family serine protease|nr:in [Thermoanaerobaculia bacterium]